VEKNEQYRGVQQRIEELKQKAAEAEKSFQKAINDPGASPLDLHQYGRQLLAAGEKDKALVVFETNAKLHPNAWPVEQQAGVSSDNNLIRVRGGRADETTFLIDGIAISLARAWISSNILWSNSTTNTA
jgi:tetratricopeptide (TPR) repeat protein